jgi:hypothetical protein
MPRQQLTRLSEVVLEVIQDLVSAYQAAKRNAYNKVPVEDYWRRIYRLAGDLDRLVAECLPGPAGFFGQGWSPQKDEVAAALREVADCCRPDDGQDGLEARMEQLWRAGLRLRNAVQALPVQPLLEELERLCQPVGYPGTLSPQKPPTPAVWPPELPAGSIDARNGQGAAPSAGQGQGAMQGGGQQVKTGGSMRVAPADPFIAFPKKERQLVSALYNKGPTPIENVLKAVYGDERPRSTHLKKREAEKLRRLVGRVNHRLTTGSNLPYEIKRSGEGYEMAPI